MSKRISGEGTRKYRRYERTAGCDVDKRVVVVGIYDCESTLIHTKEFPQDFAGAEEAAQWLLNHQIEYTILESTANYHWLFYERFRQHGLNVSVINPVTVKSLLRVEGKSDKADASTLARLAASFTLRTSNMPDEQQRHIRLVMRECDKTKEARTRLTNSFSATCSQYGLLIFREIAWNSVSGIEIAMNLSMVPCEQFPTFADAVKGGWRGRAQKLEQLCDLIPETLPEYFKEFLRRQTAALKGANLSVKEDEEYFETLIERYDLANQIAVMTTCPAVTRHLALRIIGEHGDNYWERYHSAGAFAKAIGVVPANEVSAGKLLKRKTTHGNVHTKMHLLNAVKAWVLSGKDNGPLLLWFSKYRKRATYKKAISALARHVAESLYYMGIKQEVYRGKYDRSQKDGGDSTEGAGSGEMVGY